MPAQPYGRACGLWVEKKQPQRHSHVLVPIPARVLNTSSLYANTFVHGPGADFKQPDGYRSPHWRQHRQLSPALPNLSCLLLCHAKRQGQRTSTWAPLSLQHLSAAFCTHVCVSLTGCHLTVETSDSRMLVVSGRTFSHCGSLSSKQSWCGVQSSAVPGAGALCCEGSGCPPPLCFTRGRMHSATQATVSSLTRARFQTVSEFPATKSAAALCSLDG